uniref:Leucine-rich repeat-containing N-terminal plant-type domain-containing protein n=1 Tax=Ananas comosus var. bracteatus TaxID=296719 RepID=A0A6V7PLS5_ANACO|nr:unnamed protein product [Ananas comosus var. bracteatus]
MRIGGPSGPLPAPPQPSDFLNMRQYQAYLVIQAFKATITCDPNNVTASWVGSRPCDYAGFFCAAPPDSKNTPTVASVDFNGFRLCAPSLAGFIDRLPDLALFHANSNDFSGPVPDLTRLPTSTSSTSATTSTPAPSPPPSSPSATSSSSSTSASTPSRGRSPAPSSSSASTCSSSTTTGSDSASPRSSGAPRPPTSPSPTTASRADTVVHRQRLFGAARGAPPQQPAHRLPALRDRAPPERHRVRRGRQPADRPDAALLRLPGEARAAEPGGQPAVRPVPDAVCWLGWVGSLANLSLSENFFTSIGPSCWWLLKRGVLDVRRNCIPGFPDQRPVAECLHFFSFPKFCPFLPFVPCAHFPDWPFKRAAAAVANGERRRHRRRSMWATFG